VDLMADIRKTVTSYFFRAQFGQQPQPRRVAPQRLAYSGPEETPSHEVGAGGARPAAAAQRARAAAARVDELGVSTRAAAEGIVPGAPSAAAPDPSRLATNRGGEEKKPEPVTVDAEPGRNDPCPCGSGKKYKKCHGRG